MVTLVEEKEIMYYENIEGWFSYEKLYDQMVEKYDNAIFAEIGVFKGRSITYLAEKVKESNKNIKVYAIDLFTFQKEQVAQKCGKIDEPFYEEYLKNIEPLKDYITTIKGDSRTVHEQFEDESVDFLFIDGEHTKPVLSTELTVWYPKIKWGGVIAGHDYSMIKGVIDRFFKDKQLPVVNNHDIDRASWIVYKEK